MKIHIFHPSLTPSCIFFVFLANYKNVEEVVRAVDNNYFPKVWGASFHGITSPLHWAISDASGRWDMKIMLQVFLTKFWESLNSEIYFEKSFAWS